MEYRGYKITPNMTGYVKFDFYPSDDCDAFVNHCDSIEDCKSQIDEILDEQ